MRSVLITTFMAGLASLSAAQDSHPEHPDKDIKDCPVLPKNGTISKLEYHKSLSLENLAPIDSLKFELKLDNVAEPIKCDLKQNGCDPRAIIPCNSLREYWVIVSPNPRRGMERVTDLDSLTVAVHRNDEENQMIRWIGSQTISSDCSRNDQDETEKCWNPNEVPFQPVKLPKSAEH